MKRNIALIAGGYSAEFEISIQTADHIMDNLSADLYEAYKLIISPESWYVDLENNKYIVDKNDFSFILNGKKIIFDFAYIAIHGTPGENGLLQGYFEMLKIPYSTCNVLSSALSFNKYFCNSYLKSFGLNVAKSILLRKSDKIDSNLILRELNLPCFVKPNADGSSFGITKVKKKDELLIAIKNAFKEGCEVIIEEFIDGLEFTCGMLKTKSEEIIFPVTEVIPKNDFFDFEAKYDPSMAEEITPARISEELTVEIQSLTSKIYSYLNCKGIVRVDYMIIKGNIFVLEANTVPGMTSNSFLPKQIKAAGFKLSEILSKVIENEF